VILIEAQGREEQKFATSVAIVGRGRMSYDPEAEGALYLKREGRKEQKKALSR